MSACENKSSEVSGYGMAASEGLQLSLPLGRQTCRHAFAFYEVHRLLRRALGDIEVEIEVRTAT